MSERTTIDWKGRGGVALVCAFALGAFVSWLLVAHPWIAANGSVKPLRLSQTEYPLINPLLLCNIDQPNGFNENKTVEAVVKNFIDEHIAKGFVDDMSIYISDYKDGQWVGVNENDRYDPASMLKVPLMIAYYQAGEKDPKIFSQQIAFRGDDQNTGEFFRSPNDINSGHFYSVSQLLSSMIINSDNTAAVLLEKNLDPNSLSNVYTDLGLPVPNNGTNVQYLSAKLYAYFFRILYNATYLNHADSEKALELLEQTSVHNLRDGIPNETRVAEKFGERSYVDPIKGSQGRELHDCGIVYKSNTPYMLCVMSRSKTASFTTLAKNIRDLSALVYKNI